MYGEAAQWGASLDERVLEFIIGMHDLWSRAFVHWTTGARPWWIDTDDAGGGGRTTNRGTVVNSCSSNVDNYSMKMIVVESQKWKESGWAYSLGWMHSYSLMFCLWRIWALFIWSRNKFQDIRINVVFVEAVLGQYCLLSICYSVTIVNTRYIFVRYHNNISTERRATREYRNTWGVNI